MKTYEFGASLERVWREFGESPNSLQVHKEIFAWCHFSKKIGFFKKDEKMSLENLRTLSKLKKICVHNLFFKKKRAPTQKKLCTHIFLEFGDSPNLFFFLFFLKKSFLKNVIKQRFLCEFGVSLEILQTLSKLTKKSLLDVFSKNCFFEKTRKNEFGEPPNSLQTQKKYACATFFQTKYACSHSKKNCARIFFLSLERFWRFSKLIFHFLFFWKNDIKQRFLCEFGVSLEILQTRSKLICFHCFLFFHCFFGKEEWVWSAFGDSPNSPQTRSKLIYFYFFKFHLFWGEKRNEFGVSLEILQTLSKLTPNSIQTQMISCYIVFSLYWFFMFVWKRHTTLEWVWRFSKLSPNSPQTRSKLKGFHFFYFTFFWKRGMSLERVWRVSKLAPNSCFFFAMSQPKKLLVQEALQSSASSACRTVYELLETSPPRVTPEKQEFGLWVGKGLIDHRRLVTHEW